MPSFVLSLAVLCVALTGLSAQNSSLINQLDAVKWEIPLDAWRAAHQHAKCAATGATQQGADQQWCQRCTETTGAEASEWSFYTWDVAAPVCRLEQLRVSDAGPGLEESQHTLESTLRARYDPSDTSNSVGEGSSGFYVSCSEALIFPPA